MDSQDGQGRQEPLSYAHRKERKAEFARRLSGTIELPAHAPYRMDISGYPTYYHRTDLASEYPREEILGAVKST
jgi:hypothetical protein